MLEIIDTLRKHSTFWPILCYWILCYV